MRRATIIRMLPGLSLAVVLAAVTLFATLKPEAAIEAQGRPLETVRFNMSWLPQGSMAGVFVAIDKGYYAAEGLRVEPMRGFGGIRTVNELDRGMFEFGYVDPLSVALNRAAGGRTKLVGGINMRLPAGACYVRERRTLERPKDLAGLTFGAGQSSGVQALLPAWLEDNGVAPDAVKRVQLEPAVVVSSLVEGKVDAAECWLGNSMALFQKAARTAGLTIGRLPYANFGLDVYGSGIAARDDLLAKEPGLARRFLAATYRGYADAARNPAAAVAILRKHHPLLDPAVTEQQVRETAELMASEGGALAFDPAKIGRTVQLLERAGQLDGQVAADKLFTNDFLPKEAAR